jgi:hypothetical protein
MRAQEVFESYRWSWSDDDAEQLSSKIPPKYLERLRNLTVRDRRVSNFMDTHNINLVQFLTRFQEQKGLDPVNKTELASDFIVKIPKNNPEGFYFANKSNEVRAGAELDIADQAHTDLYRVYMKTKLRAEKINTPFTLTLKEAADIFKAQGGKCALTGEKLGKGLGSSPSMDQRVPRVRGGPGYTKDNVQWVTAQINFAKQNLTNEEFADLCKKVAAHSGN